MSEPSKFPISPTEPGLTYEETPIIDPVNVVETTEAAAPPSPKHKKFHIGTVFFVVLLFGLGIWLSSQLRSFFAPSQSLEIPVPTLSPLDYTESTRAPSATGSGAVNIGSWSTYQIASGVSYQLLPEVKAPVCDSSSCSSKGTNLPGGTRFTVAPRGKGQLLPDFRGAILTDAAGREFTMTETTVGGHSVYEYIGNFTGRTGGGYTFTKIRGVLVPVSDTFAVEFNHFAPLGITTDFDSDDAVFDKIIASFNSASRMTPTARPTVSVTTPSPTPASAGF